VTDKTRVLSLTDCGGGSQVLSVAKEIGMKVWLGLWVGFEESVFEQEKDELVRMIEAGEVDETAVLGITVGSEALYREDATIDQMLLYLEQVRQIIETAQLNLPVSIVDIEPMYTAYSQLRSAVDVIYINSFPFWEAEPIETAVDYLAEKTQNLLRLQESRGKSIVIGETGWPAKGFIEGVGTASPANQQQYFIDAFCFLEEQDWEYYWFTGIDSAWREIQE
jgi:glucan 1,3-beta-glucosidase